MKCIAKSKNVLIGKKPTGCVCRICCNVYKVGGFSAQYGKITVYKKTVLSKKDGAEKHKPFLAAVKEWLRQHKEDPDRTKLKNKKSLMEVQKQLVTARTQRGEFQAPEMEFVLVDHWDEKEDGKYDASKVVEAEVQGATRRGIWKMIGKHGHFKYIQSEGVEMRDETLEEKGIGKLTDMAIDAKKQVLLSNITTARENREENAVQAPQLDLTQLLSMLGNGSGDRDSGPEAEPGLDGSEDEENEDPSNHDEEESAEEMDADRLDLFSFAGKSRAAAKAKAQPQQNPRPQASNRRQGEGAGTPHRRTSTHVVSVTERVISAGGELFR